MSLTSFLGSERFNKQIQTDPLLFQSNVMCQELISLYKKYIHKRNHIYFL